MGYGIELAKAAGSQASGNFINEAFGLIFQGAKNRAQLKQARKLQDLAIEGHDRTNRLNEEMALRMFEKTGYGAQKKQMLEAGLNPALLYGMSAGSGTTQASTGGVSNATAEVGQASRGGEGMGLMIGQMGLLQAQKENIEADTKLKETEVNKKNTEIDSLSQGITNAKIQEGILHWEQIIKRAEANVESQSVGARMSTIQSMSEQAASTAEMIERDNQIAEETKQAKINEIWSRSLGAAVQVELAQEQIKLTQEQTRKVGEEILTLISDRKLNWEKLDNEKKKTLLYERLVKFNTAQSQRTYDNILKAVDRVSDFFKKGSTTVIESQTKNVILPPQ